MAAILSTLGFINSIDWFSFLSNEKVPNKKSFPMIYPKQSKAKQKKKQQKKQQYN